MPCAICDMCHDQNSDLNLAKLNSIEWPSPQIKCEIEMSTCHTQNFCLQFSSSIVQTSCSSAVVNGMYKKKSNNVCFNKFSWTPSILNYKSYQAKRNMEKSINILFLANSQKRKSKVSKITSSQYWLKSSKPWKNLLVIGPRCIYARRSASKSIFCDLLFSKNGTSKMHCVLSNLDCK